MRSFTPQKFAAVGLVLAFALSLALLAVPNATLSQAAATPSQDVTSQEVPGVDAIPGDRDNNATKWIIIGGIGLVFIGLGVGALVWKRRLEAAESSSAHAVQDDPFAAPTAPPIAEDGHILPRNPKK